jgi:hypothetical protein
VDRRQAMGRIGVSLFALGSAAAVFVGCNSLREKLMPTEPTPTEATPAPAPIAIPVILTTAPTPAPTATPAPAPKPNPTPTPEAPAPSGGSCGLPPSNNPNGPCTMQSSSFLGQVDKAIAQVILQQPNWFDFNNKVCENCYYVKNEGKFTAAVIANLNAAGLCAYYDGEELAVKNSNSFNEQFDILLYSGHVRRGAGSYRSTCNPSWF